MGALGAGDTNGHTHTLYTTVTNGLPWDVTPLHPLHDYGPG